MVISRASLEQELHPTKRSVTALSEIHDALKQVTPMLMPMQTLMPVLVISIWYWHESIAHITSNQFCSFH